MEIGQRLYTSGEVRHLVGVSQRQVTYWDESALVRPGGRAADGRGSRRLYTVLDVLQFKVIRRLREAGLSLQKIRHALEYVQDLQEESAPLAELDVLTDGRRIVVRRSDDHLVDPLARQYLLRLPLSELLAELECGATPSLCRGEPILTSRPAAEVAPA